MAIIFRSVVEIDDEQPLGAQIKAARHAGIRWKTLIALTGFSKTHLRRLAMENSPYALVHKMVRRETPWSRAH